MTRRQTTSKDVYFYKMFESFIGHVFFRNLQCDMTLASLYKHICTRDAVFSELHDQLASLERHALPTRCFCAVAELASCYFYHHHCHHRHRYDKGNDLCVYAYQE